MSLVASIPLTDQTHKTFAPVHLRASVPAIRPGCNRALASGIYARVRESKAPPWGQKEPKNY